MRDRKEPRPSLLDLFAAPGDRRRGVFGLVCGLSADEQFMDSALERFSGRSKNQRLYNGHFSLALFLDIHNKPVQGLPGLFNPFPGRNMPEEIRLMHAKVALLGFGESSVGTPDYYRLIVSTGNWTKEAVNNSINIVWSCDYNLTQKEKKKQESKDINEAVVFWEHLLGINSDKNGYYRTDGPAKARIKDFLSTIVRDVPDPGKKYLPRFISNLLNDKGKAISNTFRADSIGAQFIQRFKKKDKQRNLIICGSGFFEQASTGGKTGEPEVIKDLLANLTEKNVLTKDPERWLVVNPRTCGAAGPWIRNNFDNIDWDLCRPKHPDFDKVPFTFHAKYVFTAYRKNDFFSRGILYLGSGNLSKQGFTAAPGSGGNIEAGVIIEVERYDDTTKLCMSLGIDPDKDLEVDNIPEDTQGEDSEQPAGEIQLPPPIVSCFWTSKTGKLIWNWTDTDWQDVTLIDQTIRPPGCTEMNITGEPPNFSLGVKVSAKLDGKSYEWLIPVFSENYMFCRPPAQHRTGQEKIDTLAAFPQYSCEDDDPTEEPGEEGRDTTNSAAQKSDFSELRNELDRFPLHLATTLLETIAAQNQQITAGQLPDWTAHLRRTLIDEMKPETKAQLMALGYDILDPLIQEDGFTPEKQSAYEHLNAALQTTDFDPVHQNEEYSEAIKEIARDWKFYAERMAVKPD